MLNVVGLLAVGFLKKNRELLRRKHRIAFKQYFNKSNRIFKRNSKISNNTILLKQPLEAYSSVRVRGKVTQKFRSVMKFPKLSVYFNVIDRILDKKIPFTPINAFKSVTGLLPIKYSKSADYFKKDNRIKIG